MALLGVGTTADPANPFSAKLNAALWTAKTIAEGGTGDLFYTMNKETAGRDLGLTLQTAYVTKALMGLFGSDRFRLAVSADGSTFFDGLIVDNATGIVDQPRLPRFKGFTNYDNYVGIDSWTKIGINNTDYNDQGAFDAGNNRFVASVAGTYLFGATLLYKINASATARMRGRLVLNGTTEIRGSLGEISATHVSLATAIWLQTMVPLTAGDTVELQGYFRVADGYFAADHTSFWGCKVGSSWPMQIIPIPAHPMSGPRKGWPTSTSPLCRKTRQNRRQPFSTRPMRHCPRPCASAVFRPHRPLRSICAATARSAPCLRSGRRWTGCRMMSSTMTAGCVSAWRSKGRLARQAPGSSQTGRRRSQRT
ncbi:hypothetical protein [Paracoccus alcaliphilus]|uniref:hypothetical protein n=1 Tax=Paracoccus alcaliphilus TaxID=34002 RepID=UPI003AF32A6E